MTFSGRPIGCRYNRLSSILLMSCLLHATTCITVTDHAQTDEQHGDEAQGQDTAAAVSADDDMLPEKVFEDDDAEKKHFMDVYSLQSGPKQLEFGHVFEDPNVWEQRYEKKDFDEQRYQGKVKWGDKDGGYGEQYWDLNHGGAGESALDNDENEQLEETTHTEHVQPAQDVQESRHRAVLYRPMVVTLVNKNKSKKSKKPSRSVRNSPKKIQEQPPSTTTETIDKKTAPVLVFDLKTGVVMDEATGNRYILKPIND